MNMFSRDLSRTQELRNNEREGSRRFRLARRDNGNQLQSAPKVSLLLSGA